MICIANKNKDILKLLLSELAYLWSKKDIALVIKEIIHANWAGEGLKLVMQSKTFKILM
jgi:hypothetical protein